MVHTSDYIKDNRQVYDTKKLNKSQMINSR